MGDRVKVSARMANGNLARDITGAAEHMGFVAICQNNTVNLQFEANSDNCRLIIGLLDQSPIVDEPFSEVDTSATRQDGPCESSTCLQAGQACT